MSPGARVGSFGALLVAIFALAVLAGRALDPASEAAESADHAAAGAGGDGGHGAAGTGAGLRLVAQSPTMLPAGRAGRLTFRIVDPHGETLRDFDVEQARRMHLIVVRRDLRRFPHLHPAEDATGPWSTTLALPDAGVYHAFADFRSGGERRTAGLDLFAGGRFEPLALPPATDTARVGGYDVTLGEHGSADHPELRFAVRRDGAPVDDLQPYLGARGHLVMLRAGDLAYEHVHPLSAGELAFATDDVAPGTYRLFLQFRHAGKVHTAAFTRAVTR